MLSTSLESPSKHKLTFYQPTSEADSIANYHEISQTFVDSEPQSFHSKQLDIKKQIQQLKSKRRTVLSLHKDTNQ